MLSEENRALVERFMDAGCYRPTDTTFGFTDKRLNELLDAARYQGMKDYVIHGPSVFPMAEEKIAEVRAWGQGRLAHFTAP